VNPITVIKTGLRFKRLLEHFENGTKDWERRRAAGDDMSKSLFQSKVFWVNAISLGLELTRILPIPPGTLLVVTNVLNIGLRILTVQPVHVISPE
jgi:hypothetical protein